MSIHIEQRDHLGAHLKNTVSKVYQISDGIIQLATLSRSGKLGKGTALKKIIELASNLKRWNDVPANIAYKFSPLGLMDDEKKWEKEKKESSKTILNKKDADEKIYPTLEDIKTVMEK